MNENNLLGFEVIGLDSICQAETPSQGANTCCLLLLLGCKNTSTEINKD